MKNKIFAVIGGDARQFYLAEYLSESGNSTLLCGFDSFPLSPIFAEKLSDIDYAITKADFIVLPLPCFGKDGFIFAPFSNKKINPDDILSGKIEGKFIFGGKMPDDFTKKIISKNAVPVDYLKSEEMAILNAIPTVEGAISVAIENSDDTIFESVTLVSGYGRIGKLLSKYLKNMGANVFVSARKSKDLASIRANGYIPIKSNDIAENMDKFDIIFNTVPSIIFNENELKKSKKDALFIELASAPYGIDLEVAKNLNKNVIVASGLPGKTAPKKSGQIIRDVIEKIIEEEKYG